MHYCDGSVGLFLLVDAVDNAEEAITQQLDYEEMGHKQMGRKYIQHS